MSEPDQPQWTWPAGRAVVLYHWSWFDPQEGDVVVGWSQRDAADERDYVHFEAEHSVPARTVQVDRSGDVFVEPHTFTAMTLLPPSLQDSDRRPLPWIRELLGEK